MPGPTALLSFEFTSRVLLKPARRKNAERAIPFQVSAASMKQGWMATYSQGSVAAMSIAQIRPDAQAYTKEGECRL